VAFIERGYQDITPKLQSLGAAISRIEEADHDCPAADCEEPVEWGVAPAR
jgi:hypothetical protein